MKMKITRTKRGKYTTVVHIGQDLTGKPVKKRFTASSSEELKQAVRDFQSRNRVIRESHLFRDALERYISIREPYKSPSTIRAYKSIQTLLTSKFAPFCSASASSVTDKSAQQIIDTLKLEGYAPKTIKNITGLINSVLIAEGLQPVRIQTPRIPLSDREIYTQGEVKMILCLIHGHKLEVPFQLAILGLRRGEICALDLSDLDRNDVLHVHKSIVAISGGGFQVNQMPKTDTSNRYIQLPHHLAEQIRKQGCVSPYKLSSITVAYRDFLAKYKFPPYRLHDCRHFFASYCHACGVVEADILAAGGWKTPNIMRSVYRHSMAQNKASSAVTNLLTAH